MIGQKASNMPEFVHPPVEASFDHWVSMQQDFAERAFETLRLYGIDCCQPQGDYEVTYPITPRIDAISEIPELEVALRLRRRQVFGALTASSNELTPGQLIDLPDPTDRLVVIELQYGTMDAEDWDDDEGVVDEDFAWHPYVQTIIDKETDEIIVVDAQTGNELSDMDLLQATRMLDMLRNELRAGGYVLANTDEVMPIRYALLAEESEMMPLESTAQLDLNYCCEMCGAENTPCGHRSPQWN